MHGRIPAGLSTVLIRARYKQCIFKHEKAALSGVCPIHAQNRPLTGPAPNDSFLDTIHRELMHACLSLYTRKSREMSTTPRLCVYPRFAMEVRVNTGTRRELNCQTRFARWLFVKLKVNKAPAFPQYHSYGESAYPPSRSHLSNRRIHDPRLHTSYDTHLTTRPFPLTQRLPK